MFGFQLWIDGQWVIGSIDKTPVELLELLKKNAQYGLFPGRRVVKADDGTWVPVDATE
jgi:hypothetical protein